MTLCAGHGEGVTPAGVVHQVAGLALFAGLSAAAFVLARPLGRGYSYELLQVQEMSPPGDVAAAFGFSGDDLVVMRHRLLLHDDAPVELSWSYYPMSIAAGSPLADRRRMRGGAPQALADLGFPQSRFVDRISVRQPTESEVQALDLPMDVPVFRQFRVIYSDGDRPVEVSVLIKGGHLYELSYVQ